MTIWTPAIARGAGPLYLAIADAIAADTASGRLAAGARLPTHRELAERLRVTVGTVSRAYAEAARRGLISGEVGRGTFARGPVSELGAALPVPDAALIDLSLNHPPPLDEARAGSLSRTLATIARRADLASLLEYAPGGGAPDHRAAGVAWMALAGVTAQPEQVLVTSGSQHAINALLLAVARPGDLVLTESLTYPGMRALAGLLDLRLQGLAMDEHGLRPDAFEAACRAGGARALYCIPTLQNPTAAVLPEARRREIARIARAHGVLIVEDDVHGLLDEGAPPPIAAFAPDVACYLLGTAKTLAPGLRTGFVLAPPALVPRVASGIRATTWMAAPLMAEIVARWIADGTARQILKHRRDEVRARQKLAAAALGGLHFAAHPSSPHLWLHLPAPWRSETFADEARRRGVAVTPAQTFLVGRGSVPHAVRVCLGAARDRSQLERGLATLATLASSGPVPEAQAMVV